jgi:hypothetical protein
MYKSFSKEYKTSNDISGQSDKGLVLDGSWNQYLGLTELFTKFEGKGFNSGIYRVLNTSDVEYWASILREAHPALEPNIIPFGYDWLGRVFAVNTDIQNTEEPEILLFCPFTGDILQLPFSPLEFHNEILHEPEDIEALLEKELFDEFTSNNPCSLLAHNTCVGLNIPLFLNGNLDPENMKVVKMVSYWEITSQLIQQIPRD